MDTTPLALRIHWYGSGCKPGLLRGGYTDWLSKACRILSVSSFRRSFSLVFTPVLTTCRPEEAKSSIRRLLNPLRLLRDQSGGFRSRDCRICEKSRAFAAQSPQNDVVLSTAISPWCPHFDCCYDAKQRWGALIGSRTSQPGPEIILKDPSYRSGAPRVSRRSAA